jgi:hypothetical protein
VQVGAVAVVIGHRVCFLVHKRKAPPVEGVEGRDLLDHEVRVGQVRKGWPVGVAVSHRQAIP